MSSPIEFGEADDGSGLVIQAVCGACELVTYATAEKQVLAVVSRQEIHAALAETLRRAGCSHTRAA